MLRYRTAHNRFLWISWRYVCIESWHVLSFPKISALFIYLHIYYATVCIRTLCFFRSVIVGTGNNRTCIIRSLKFSCMWRRNEKRKETTNRDYVREDTRVTTSGVVKGPLDPPSPFTNSTLIARDFHQLDPDRMEINIARKFCGILSPSVRTTLTCRGS